MKMTILYTEKGRCPALKLSRILKSIFYMGKNGLKERFPNAMMNSRILVKNVTEVEDF